MDDSLNSVFDEFQQYIDNKEDTRETIRDCVRDLDQTARRIQNTLQKIHQPEGIKNLQSVSKVALEIFTDVRTQMLALIQAVPKGQYYRFHDQYRYILQQMTYLIALITFLQKDRLITYTEAAESLSLTTDWQNGFHLDLDDYLLGVLKLSNELSRFAVNAVTAGDYDIPRRVARFVGELDSGFRLLNLKNDILRKRFDGLKYDVKKAEEVVYDLTVRGLTPEEKAT